MYLIYMSFKSSLLIIILLCISFLIMNHFLSFKYTKESFNGRRSVNQSNEGNTRGARANIGERGNQSNKGNTRGTRANIGDRFNQSNEGNPRRAPVNIGNRGNRSNDKNPRRAPVSIGDQDNRPNDTLPVRPTKTSKISVMSF